MEINMNYTDYIVDMVQKLLKVPSPTGFTKHAAEFVMKELKAMGYEPKLTAKGAVLTDLGGGAVQEGIPGQEPILMTAHMDTLGAMVAQIKGNGSIDIKIAKYSLEALILRVR